MEALVVTCKSTFVPYPIFTSTYQHERVDLAKPPRMSKVVRGLKRKSRSKKSDADFITEMDDSEFKRLLEAEVEKEIRQKSGGGGDDGKKKFECKSCGKRFALEGFWIRHMRRVHKGEPGLDISGKM